MQTKRSLSVVTLILAILFIFNISPVSAKPFSGKTIQLPLQEIAPGQSQILIDFQLPEHHEYAFEAPSTIWTRIKDPALLKVSPNQPKPQNLDLTKLPHPITLTAEAGRTVVAIDTRVHYCDKDTQICLTDLMRIKFPIKIIAGAPSSVKLEIPICSKVIVCPEPDSATK